MYFLPEDYMVLGMEGLHIATVISHYVIQSLIIIYKFPTNYPVIYYLLIRRAWDEYFYYY